MILLLDQNLSPRLIERLREVFPAMEHVAHVGLAQASDQQIWDYARATGCIIVTKDTDFNDLSVTAGFPPQVIWVGLGNCTTTQIERVLRDAAADIHSFV